MSDRASNDGKCKQAIRFPAPLILPPISHLRRLVQACKQIRDLSRARARSLLARGCVREKIQIYLHALTTTQKSPGNIGQTQCKQAQSFLAHAYIACTPQPQG